MRIGPGHAKAKFKHAHDQSAEEGAKDRAAPAEERDAPDHLGVDGVGETEQLTGFVAGDGMKR